MPPPPADAGAVSLWKPNAGSWRRTLPSSVALSASVTFLGSGQTISARGSHGGGRVPLRQSCHKQRRHAPRLLTSGRQRRGREEERARKTTLEEAMLPRQMTK